MKARGPSLESRLEAFVALLLVVSGEEEFPSCCCLRFVFLVEFPVCCCLRFVFLVLDLGVLLELFVGVVGDEECRGLALFVDVRWSLLFFPGGEKVASAGGIKKFAIGRFGCGFAFAEFTAFVT